MADDFEVGGPLPEESTNRPFVIAAAVLGGFMVLSIICLGLYALVLAPRQRAARETQAANNLLQNTQVIVGMTETAGALQPSFTPPPTRPPLPSNTPTPTRVVVLPTDTPTATTAPPSTAGPLTQTAAAQATINALAATMGRTPTATALPTTGFADDVGLPNLILLGGGLVVIVFLARRLRTRASP
jgi:type II secretory pathway pseudopilin PulG